MNNRQAWCPHGIKDLRIRDLLGATGYFKHPESCRWRKCVINRISEKGAVVTYSGDLTRFVKWENIYS